MQNYHAPGAKVLKGVSEEIDLITQKVVSINKHTVGI